MVFARRCASERKAYTARNVYQEYMKPAMCVVELQHKTQLLQASQTNIVQTSGLDQGDQIQVSSQGGGSNIWDR